MLKMSLWIAAVVLTAAILLSCSALGTAAQASPPAATLPLVEISQYEGQDLSSIKDIQDNAIKGTQYINKTDYRLQVTGLVNSPQSLTYDQVLGLDHYQKVVRLICVGHWSANILWEGVLVKDLIDKAGVQAGANTVIFYAVDGYSTSLPLDYIQNNNILLAYKMNGVVIPAEKGFPFMLVAQDKLGYKWIKWLDTIELSGNSAYKGYAESMGESNDANATLE